MSRPDVSTGQAVRSESESSQLKASHNPSAISKRLHRRPHDQWIGDAVLGGVDGCVSTFAVVAGAAGGGLSATVIIVLGGAKLLGDALSMAVSNYESVRAEIEYRDAARGEEKRHMRMVPEGEREEVRQIFAGKGFRGETLERIVDQITKDGRLWLDTMLREELGLSSVDRTPGRAALTTYAAFVLVGAIPLVPFLLPIIAAGNRLAVSAVVTGLAFLGVGAVKGAILRRKVILPALTTLATGGAAAAVAYVVALSLRAVYGVG